MRPWRVIVSAVLLPALTAFAWPRPSSLVAELPGSDWTERAPRFELTYARPWPLPGLHLGGARGGLVASEAVDLRWRVAWLGAGEVRSWRAGLSLGARGPLGWLRIGWVEEEVVVATFVPVRDRGAHVAVGAPFERLAVSFRHERPFGSSRSRSAPRSELVARWTADAWSAALLRASSPWGEAPRWEAGIALGSRPGAGLGLLWAESGSGIAFRLDRHGWRHRLRVVLEGPRAGAVAFSVGWSP